MSGTQELQRRLISLYDFLGKLIPGGVILLVIVLLLPSNSSLLQFLSSIRLITIIAFLPMAYIIGAILEAVASRTHRRKNYFHEQMHSVRHHINILDPSPQDYSQSGSNEITASGGNHVPREVWIDIVDRFDLPFSYLRSCQNTKKDCKLQYGNYTPPLFYRIIVFPILYSAFRLTLHQPESIRNKLEYDRIYYNAEHEGFKIVKKYMIQNGIGQIDRFNSMYSAFRTFTLLFCILTIIFVFSTITQYLFPYQSLVQTHWLILGAIISFFSIPYSFSRMEQFDRVRDNDVIYAYYSNIVVGSNDV